MGNSAVWKRTRTGVAGLIVGVMVTAGLVALGGGAAAAADDPGGLPPLLQRDENVVTSDPIPTVQIDNGYVWAQTTIGSTVYAVGKFDNAREPKAPPGTALTARSNVLAYNIDTGALLPFAPQVNGVIKAVAASPDGTRIYIGGSFNKVNGKDRWNIAAIDAKTGELVPGFVPSIGGSGVYALATSGTTVYAGGLFTQANGSPRKNLAAFDTTNGALRPWAPQTDLQVDAMVMDPAGADTIVGGRFSQVNGNTEMRGSASVDKTTGALNTEWELAKTVKNGAGSGIYAGKAGTFGLATDATGVYGTGWGFANAATGSLEGTFAAEAGTGKVRWIADCLGDHYGVYSTGKVVYTTSHTHSCETLGLHPEQAPRVHRYSEAYTADARGTLAPAPTAPSRKDWGGTPAPSPYAWSPDWAVGTTTGLGQAGLSITGTGNMISIGGEFRSVNNGQFEGLVRFSTTPPEGPKDGPRLSGDKWVPTATSLTPGRVKVTIPANWDRDDLTLTYELRRADSTTPLFTTKVDSTWWNLPAVSFEDTTAPVGAQQQYTFTATDSNGHTVSSKTTTATAAASTPAYSNAVLADGPQLYYPLGTVAQDVAGTNSPLIRSGATPRSSGVPKGVAGATALDGTETGRVDTTTKAAAPASFSAEMWFQTSTTAGGVLFDFESSAVGFFSKNYDRTVYMSDNGRLNFGVYNDGTKVLTTATAYNDNRWHHVVASVSPEGMKLFIDGKLDGQLPTVTKAQDFNGYWKIGGGRLKGWANEPTKTLAAPANLAGDAHLVGNVDEFAVYPYGLTAGQVKTHYSVGNGSTAPVAAYTAAASGLTATFDASTSVPPGSATISDYRWDFGDGSTGTGKTPSHTYAKPGTYAVTLTITDSQSLMGSVTKPVVVQGANALPTASFTLSASGLTVSTDASASTDADGSVRSYRWDWGDGTTGEGASATHTYATAGTRTVTPTVTDDVGGSATTTREAVVAEPAPLASDEFERTAGPGWGEALAGGAWKITGGSAAAASVADGSGQLKLAAGDTRHATLNAPSVPNPALETTFRVDQPSSTGGSYIGVIARDSSAGRYLVRAWLRSDGTVWLVAHRDGTVLATRALNGVTVTPGTTYTLKAAVTGADKASLVAKLWATDAAEPADWQLRATDAAPLPAGGVGLSGSRSASATAPLGVSFDTFRVRAAE
ncbi:PKD domain-containing protein [Microbacterium sp. HSID17254]|uniref:PKD domain-containing protein n=1 Tax=Microbacterium sp. HSID17254 TaxID=2419509 RepID=UPI001EE94965|nr:PKD domain-containing protein [Microbacterium sp. HSID17254]